MSSVPVVLIVILALVAVGMAYSAFRSLRIGGRGGLLIACFAIGLCLLAVIGALWMGITATAIHGAPA